MSESDARSELGELSRRLRRAIEREAALGGGELLARAATLRRVAASGAGLVMESPVAAPAPAPVAASAPATTTPRARAASTSDAAFEQAATLAMRSELDELVLPPAHGALSSRDLEERAAISAVALPILEQVAAEARVCTKCGLCETRTQAVPGVGSARSGIVFVGEAPGAEEDRKGEPFVGRAGELLTRIIAAMNDAQLIPGVPLDRSTVYILNVLKCRPPENRNPLPFEIEMCSPYLKRQLDALKPRVICCLGKFAAELLVGAKGTIASLRGKTYRYQGARLIVTYHPAACLRNPGYKRPVWEDMQMLAREYLSD